MLDLIDHEVWSIWKEVLTLWKPELAVNETVRNRVVSYHRLIPSESKPINVYRPV